MARRKKRIPRNMGRIEFIACRDTIDALYEQGYDYKKIHAALVQKGKITMSYATFCYHMSRFLKALRERHEREGTQPTSAYAPASFRQNASRQQSFSVNKTPSSGEMI